MSHRWPKALTGKRFLLAAFRVLALVPAFLELALGPDEFSSVPRAFPLVGAILYSGFKIAQPLRWHQSPLPNAALTTIDVLVSLTLIMIPGEIHMPFSLYALAPVLTSSLVLSRRSTLVVAVTMAAGYSAAYFSHPFSVTMENLSTNYFTYLVALGFTAMLPYAINSKRQQQLQSGAILGERHRLAREIHDGLCQTVGGVRWEMQMLRRDAGCKGRLEEKLGQLEGQLKEAQLQARESIEFLRTFTTDRPLLSQIEASLERLHNDTGIEGHLEAGAAEPCVDDLVRLQVLHICEEALRNVANHSKARHVTVRVRAPNGHLQVDIADDGCGLDTARFVGGHGLVVMKERAESLGGRLQALSVPGEGTQIQFEVPRRCSPDLALQ